MDFNVSVYDVILTYYENIDLGSASVNISLVSQYHIIYTDLKVHNCIMYHPSIFKNLLSILLKGKDSQKYAAMAKNKF